MGRVCIGTWQGTAVAVKILSDTRNAECACDARIARALLLLLLLLLLPPLALTLPPRSLFAPPRGPRAVRARGRHDGAAPPPAHRAVSRLCAGRRVRRARHRDGALPQPLRRGLRAARRQDRTAHDQRRDEAALLLRDGQGRLVPPQPQADVPHPPRHQAVELHADQLAPHQAVRLRALAALPAPRERQRHVP